MTPAQIRLPALLIAHGNKEIIALISAQTLLEGYGRSLMGSAGTAGCGRLKGDVFAWLGTLADAPDLKPAGKEPSQ